MVPPGNLSVDISDRPELHLLHKQVQASEQHQIYRTAWLKARQPVGAVNRKITIFAACI
ncbi:MAG: hypothetical protein K2I19_02775 [Muribaculaceae bacterium]|nr:hypothetical protein [Muribaculaceae bacterium]